MPSATINLFNFYQKYLWKAANFTDQQTYTLAMLESGREGMGAVAGLQVVPLGGLNVRIKAGVAMNSAGRLLVLLTDTDTTMTSPAGNPSRSYLVLRPVDTQTDSIQNPSDPLSNVSLNVTRTAVVAEIAGTPAGSPVYPSLVSGDFPLMGFKLTTSIATIATSNFDTLKRGPSSLKEQKVVRVSGTYSADGTEDVIEMDCTSGAFAVTLADPTLRLCKQTTFVKVDSSANAGTLTGTISGVSGPTLDTQYDAVNAYSNGNAYIQI